MNKKEDNVLIDLNIVSSIIFILASLVSLYITLDEKQKNNGKATFITTRQALNISFYNRIIILITVLISLYVGCKSYESETKGTRGKYKSGLLLSTNILTLIGALIILYVSYLNKMEQSLDVSDIENPLI